MSRLPLYLDAAESVFVVFSRNSSDPFFDSVAAMALDEKRIPAEAATAKIVIRKAIYGVPGDKTRRAT